MKEFDWENFKEEDVAVHCKTEDEAKNFLKLCSDNNIKWRTNNEATIKTNFNEYKSNTTYEYGNCKDVPVGLCYESIDYYSEQNTYAILEWENYMNKEFTKDDLQPDMVVVLRDGRIGNIKNNIFGTLVVFNNWNEPISYSYKLKDYKDDFKNDVSSIDIMKVFGFCKYYSQEYDFSTEFRELLWERKEKSAKDIEIESIQAEMDKLSKRLDELKETH